MILDTVIFGNITLWNILAIIVILGIALLIIQIITLNLRKALSDKLRKNEMEILLKIVRYSIIFIAFISILPTLSIDLTGILLAGGFAGLVLGFASQSVVSNLVSGIFLIFERPIKIGDEIQIEGAEGYVEDIRLLSTVVRSYEGIYVRLPNEKVFTSMITNYVANVARRFKYTIGISYRDDASRAIEIIAGLLEQHPYVLKEPKPLIYVDSLGDSSVNIAVYIWSPISEWFTTKNELLRKIKITLEEAGIEIPFPQRVIWFGKEEELQEEP